MAFKWLLLLSLLISAPTFKGSTGVANADFGDELVDDLKDIGKNLLDSLTEALAGLASVADTALEKLRDKLSTGDAIGQDSGNGGENEGKNGRCTTIMDYVASNENLTTLNSALEAAGSKVEDVLGSSQEKITVFAPNNAAFSGLLNELNVTASELLDRPDTVKAILGYHIIPGGSYTSSDISDGMELETIENSADNIVVSRASDGSISLQGAGSSAEVVKANVEACDAVAHVIDDVLLPVEFQ